MNKLMEFLHAKFRAFFDFWARFTGTETKWYRDGKLQVNWPIVTFMLFVMFLAVLLLPSGLADIFNWYWYE